MATTGQNLPPPQSPFVNAPDAAGGIAYALSFTGYQFLLSLISLGSSFPATVGTNLKATGTNQATALQLSNDWNQVTQASGATGVLLSSLQPGQSQVVVNVSGTPINVYPPPGFGIDALGLNQAYSLASGSRISFDFFTDTQIYS